MLNLSVSTQSCIPGKRIAPAEGEARPTKCHTCGAPGGRNGELLEGHLIGGGKWRFMCPMCHAVLHLDVAGKLNAGRIIWLPELSQEQLNIHCLATFVAKAAEGGLRNDAQASEMIAHAVRVYKGLLKRTEPVETFFGGSGNKTLIPRQFLSSPTYVAGLMVRAQREAKLSAKMLADRLEGLRFLPDPIFFDDYVRRVARLTSGRFHAREWLPAASADLQKRELASSDDVDVEHFDASSNDTEQAQPETAAA